MFDNNNKLKDQYSVSDLMSVVNEFNNLLNYGNVIE